jgi:hypothetical protein
MRYENIADIYSANKKLHEQFVDTLSQISEPEAATLPEGEKWSINQIVEHVSMVDFGIARICSKLLEGAKMAGVSSDGSFSLSPNFTERAAVIAGIKVEAPERVHPTGEVSLDESIGKMNGNLAAFEAMRPDLQRLDISGPKFPHPFIGDMNAGEWLVMAGLHKQRHSKQIEALLEKIRQ